MTTIESAHRRKGRHRHDDKRLMRQAARSVAEGASPSQAMREIGYSPTTADHKPQTLTKNPVFIDEQRKLKETIFVKIPTVYADMAQVMDDGLHAERSIIVSDPTSKKKTQKVLSVPDQQERRKTVELLGKILGDIGDADRPSGTMNISSLVVMIQTAERERGLNPTV